MGSFLTARGLHEFARPGGIGQSIARTPFTELTGAQTLGPAAGAAPAGRIAVAGLPGRSGLGSFGGIRAQAAPVAQLPEAKALRASGVRENEVFKSGLSQFEACILSNSTLKASKSYAIPLRTVLHCRTVAAVATASRISASVAPFARALLVWA